MVSMSVVCKSAKKKPETTTTRCSLKTNLSPRARARAGVRTFFAHVQQAKSPRKKTMKAANGPLQNRRTKPSRERKGRRNGSKRENDKRGVSTGREVR